MVKYKDIQWVVQSNLNFKQDVIEICNACDKFGIKHQTIEVIPFSSTLPEFDKSRKSIFYGSITLSDLVYQDQNLRIGVFFNPYTFLMYNYISKWQDYMLNSSGKLMTIEELVNSTSYKSDEDLFIRPNEDNKLFAGEVVQFKEIQSWYDKLLEINLDYSTPILVSKPYNIAKEWRLWIVEGKVITASQYREYFKLKKQLGCPQEVIDFAEARCKEYIPHEVFVMDVCLSGDSYYIVECGTMNSSGFYCADIESIVKEVSNYFITVKI